MSNKDRRCINDNYTSNWLNKKYVSEAETLSVNYLITFCDYYHTESYIGSDGCNRVVLNSRKEVLDFIELKKKDLNSNYPYIVVSKTYLIPPGHHISVKEKEYFDNPNYDGKGWIHQTKESDFKNYKGENKQERLIDWRLDSSDKTMRKVNKI